MTCASAGRLALDCAVCSAVHLAYFADLQPEWEHSKGMWRLDDSTSSAIDAGSLQPHTSCLDFMHASFTLIFCGSGLPIDSGFFSPSAETAWSKDMYVVQERACMCACQSEPALCGLLHRRDPAQCGATFYRSGVPDALGKGRHTSFEEHAAFQLTLGKLVFLAPSAQRIYAWS